MVWIAEPKFGVVLTTGDLDQVLGLLPMREPQPVRIHAIGAVRALYSAKTPP